MLRRRRGCRRGRSLWVPGGPGRRSLARTAVEVAGTLAGAAEVGAAATAGLAVGIAGGTAHGLARGTAGSVPSSRASSSSGQSRRSLLRPALTSWRETLRLLKKMHGFALQNAISLGRI